MIYLFHQYLVHCIKNIRTSYPILKSLFLAFARCEIISLRVLPISTPVTHEIKKGNKKDEKRRERERETRKTYTGIVGRCRCKIACFARGHAVDVFTSAWRFYDRSRCNERLGVDRTTLPSTEFDKQQHTWDMHDRLRVSHKRSKPWPIIFENRVRKERKKRRVSRSGSLRILDLINTYAVSL